MESVICTRTLCACTTQEDDVVVVHLSYILCFCHLKIKVPPQGFFVGKFFGFGPTVPWGDNWTTIPKSSVFDVSSRGDQLFVYCLDNGGDPHFLWGTSFNGPWASPGLNATDYGNNASALPATLVEHGNVALEHCDNYIWMDPSADIPANKSVQISKLMNPDNYRCDNDVRIEFEPSAALSVPLVASSLALVVASLFVTWRM